MMSFASLLTLLLLGHASKEAVKGNEYALAKQLAENDFVYFQIMDERKKVH